MFSVERAVASHHVTSSAETADPTAALTDNACALSKQDRFVFS